MAQIGGDKGSAEWESNRTASRGKLTAPWLAESLEKLDKKQAGGKRRANGSQTSKPRASAKKTGKSPSPASQEEPAVKHLEGAVKRPMPTSIQPMLATIVETPFDDPGWLFEIKWDGYRALTFLENGRVRLTSRNQNDLTPRYPELRNLGDFLRASSAILDGEVVVLDEEGRASFSLMQQRTGIRSHGRQAGSRSDLPVIYYIFDLLYLDGYDLRRVRLVDRKRLLGEILNSGDIVRFSDHYAGRGTALFEAAKQKGLEGILAKKINSCYEERRSREWLKIKITQTVDCVIGGYTDPEGARQYFGSLVLGLYNDKKQLVHVGNAGTGFNQVTLKQVFAAVKEIETGKNPFFGPVDLRKVHWTKPARVAEVKFSEWTHETAEGGVKLRAPVFMGLREDKDPEECTLRDQARVLKAEE